jgi:glycerol kinase
MNEQLPLILAIDQGTTSTRALIFDNKGNIIAKSQRELPLITPHSGWVEQDPDQIWDDALACCHDVLAQVDIDKVIGIAIANQRETTVMWDKNNGKPLYNAIVWQDRRTADFCRTIKSHEHNIQSRTGLLADPYFSATKIKWILDNTEKNPNAIFGTIDSYLLWHLTGSKIHATDISNAARTMLYNIHKQEWDKDQCELMGISMDILPMVMDNCANYGDCTLFNKTLPILAMAGDQQAATFGQACFDKGMMKSTYGTGCFALMNTGATCITSTHKLLSTIAWRINGQVTYALEGSIFVAGAAIQFLRDNLQFFDNAEKSEALAISVTNSDGVVFVPAFTGLGAPYWDADARGAIMGLSRGTTTAHITRAALEAQAFQTRDLMSAMAADTGQEIKTIRIDGGLAANDFVCQNIANQAGILIDRPLITEATVWGVATMGFLQAGIFKSFDDISAIYKLDRQFKSDGNEEKNDKLYSQWQTAVKAVMGVTLAYPLT